MGLDTVELVMAFEEEFGIEISDEVAERILSIGDARDEIVILLNEKTVDAAKADPEYVLKRVQEITCNHAGVSLAQVGPEKRFVRDLGMD